MRRLVTIVVSVGLAVGLLSGTALANKHEWPPGFEHGHALLIGVDVEFTPDEVVVNYRKCVEMKPLPVMAHHHSIHQGRASDALFNAGNGVLPLSPLTPWDSCDELPNPLVFPNE